MIIRWVFIFFTPAEVYKTVLPSVLSLQVKSKKLDHERVECRSGQWELFSCALLQGPICCHDHRVGFWHMHCHGGQLGINFFLKSVLPVVYEQRLTQQANKVRGEDVVPRPG